MQDTERKVRVTGDWLPEGHPGYEAVVTGTWNGFACPEFDEVTARRVAHDTNALAEQDPTAFDRIQINPDSFVIFPSGGEPGDEEYVFVNPETGRYAIGAYGWCWMEVESA